MSIATISFIAIVTGLALMFFAGYVTGTMRKEESPELKIKRLRKEIDRLEKSLPPGLQEINDRAWVLDENQQSKLVRRPTGGKPTHSRPSDLSNPQMGEGRHG